MTDYMQYCDDCERIVPVTDMVECPECGNETCLWCSVSAGQGCAQCYLVSSAQIEAVPLPPDSDEEEEIKEE